MAYQDVAQARAVYWNGRQSEEVTNVAVCSRPLLAYEIGHFALFESRFKRLNSIPEAHLASGLEICNLHLARSGTCAWEDR